MNAARDLVNRGLHAEALSEYLWCFDHGHLEDPGFGGSRVSFLLGYMQDLAESYPPAMEALRERRDAAESRLLHEVDDRTSAVEFAQISANLGESDQSLALFERLLNWEDRPIAQKELLHFVLPLLVEGRRYDVVLQVTPDPLGVVEELIHTLKTHDGWLRADCVDREMSDFLHRSFVDESADYYESLLAADPSAAGRCAERIIETHPRGASYATLIAHAVHAGAHQAARSLAERGLQTLPETERAAVAEAAQAVPSSPE